MEVDWDKKAIKDGFVQYDFTNREMLWIEKESVQVGKRARRSGGSSTTATLAAVPVLLQADGTRAHISAISRD